MPDLRLPSQCQTITAQVTIVPKDVNNRKKASEILKLKDNGEKKRSVSSAARIDIASALRWRYREHHHSSGRSLQAGGRRALILIWCQASKSPACRELARDAPREPFPAPPAHSPGRPRPPALGRRVRSACLRLMDTANSAHRDDDRDGKRRINHDACAPRVLLPVAHVLVVVDVASTSRRAAIKQNSRGWLGSRAVSVLDSGAEGPGFRSQP